MEKMKAALLHAPFKLTVGKVQKPVVGRKDVLVRTEAVGVCGTDVETYRGSYSVKYPLVMGHEAAGEIVEIGQDVGDVRLGDRVVIDPIFYCGKCPLCQKGKTNLCEHGGLLGRDIGQGAYAEYILMPHNMVIKFARISFEEAAMIELLATVYHGQRRVDILHRESVAILGQGAAGLLHTKLAKLSGAGLVIVASRSDWKLKLAHDYGGADVTIDPSREDLLKTVLRETNGKGADVVIEAAGSPDTVKQAYEIVSPGGRILQFGTLNHQIDNFNLLPIYLKEVAVFGSRAYVRDELEQATRLVTSAIIDLKPLITREFPLEGIEEGLLTHNDVSKRLRILIKPKISQ